MRLERLQDDLRLAARGLARAKGLAAAAVLTLALGIAGTTILFALVHGVLLRPLPVRDQDRLLVAWREVRAGGGHWPFRTSDRAALPRESRALESVAGVGYNGAYGYVAVEDGAVSQIQAASVTGDYFHVLGAAPVLGRAIEPGDDVSGAEHVLVLAHGLWQRRYGGSPDVVGRRLVIEEQPFRIVGVMPPDLDYPRGVEAWMPVAADSALLTNPAFHIDVDLVARVRPGVTPAQAEADIQALGSRLDASESAGAPRDLAVVTRPFVECVMGDVRRPVLVLFGAVGLVLLVACANVANLLLLRGEARRTEMALRAALGAGRARLARQLLAESALLAAAAAATGLAAAAWTLPALLARVPGGLPRAEAVRVDPAVVLFAAGAAFVAAALAGLAPLASVAGSDLATELRTGVRGATTRAMRRGRRGLVIAQVALAVTVVAAAGLLVRSLLRLQSADMGIDDARLFMVELEMPRAQYSDRGRRLRFLDEAVRQLRGAGPIVAATPVNSAPYAGTAGWDALFTAEGQTEEQSAANPLLDFEAVHAGYFETVGLPLLRGRGFDPDDREGRPLVAVVSEALAARTWPGQDPIGKRLKIGRTTSDQPWRTVVGVARTARYRELAAPRPALYVPAEQFIVAAPRLLLQSAAPLASVAATVRERIAAVAPDVRVTRVATFAELRDAPLARPRFTALLITVFGAVALLLSAVGAYAVIGAAVRQREREMGVRVALGATATDVRRLVVGEAVRLGAGGAAVGLLAAAGMGRVLRGLLFEITPLDPLSLATAALLLVGVSAAAAYGPARRAARVDPATTLRAS